MRELASLRPPSVPDSWSLSSVIPLPDLCRIRTLSPGTQQTEARKELAPAGPLLLGWPHRFRCSHGRVELYSIGPARRRFGRRKAGFLQWDRNPSRRAAKYPQDLRYPHPVSSEIRAATTPIVPKPGRAIRLRAARFAQTRSFRLAADSPFPPNGTAPTNADTSLRTTRLC
jgi:hypothetical protein